MGNRCQNEAIKQFSLINARRFVRENRSIPNSIYHQKHAILDRKTTAEEFLKRFTYEMELSRRNIVLLMMLSHYHVIDERHKTSLLAPFNGQIDESVLMEWLGLGHGHEQMSEDLINSIGLETSPSEMNADGNEETKQTTDQEENAETKPTTDETVEKIEGAQKNEDGMNEEEEEEQRRRDELDSEENEDFIRSMVVKPKTNEAASMNNQISIKKKGDTDDDDGEGEWQTVQKKPYNRRRMLERILHYPTTLNDETVNNIHDDVWQLSIGQRHDLYRYWLLKYQQALSNAARDARQEYNQAITALGVYHQEEDYYILKDSIIVAMTTTGAAKYHTVLEKLRK